MTVPSGEATSREVVPNIHETVKLTPRIAKNILAFMERVSLVPAEIRAFQEAELFLKAFLAMNGDDPEEG